MKNYDYIVVGAGSAGCALAARLVEAGDRKVLLVEAGGSDLNPLLHVPLVAGKIVRAGWHTWRLSTEPSPGANNRRITYPRGKLLGGTSSINGMVYIRGNPADYDEYAALGNRSWGYEDVLPYFKRSEDHASRRDAYHGVGGPLKVTKGSFESPIYDAFLESGNRSGYPSTGDFNGSCQEGFGRYDFTISEGRRQSSSVSFVRPVSKHPNLTVVTGAQVTRITISGGRATGIEYVHRGIPKSAGAGETIVSCGSVHSPHLLMLSGIGDPESLSRAGISPIHALRGVGRNLSDHFRVQLYFQCARPITLHHFLRVDRVGFSVARALLFNAGVATMFPAEAGAFTKIDSSDALPEAQWFCFLGTHTAQAWFPGFGSAKDHVFAISAVLLRPTSRGEIRLKSSNPMEQPLIFPNVLQTQSDLDRVSTLVGQIKQLSERPGLRDIIAGRVGSGALDQRRDWMDWARQETVTSSHPVGTCKMGNDDLAVVDDCLRVRGIEGLRVADASVFPVVPRGNTNAPTIMVAEKAADLILGRRSIQ